MSVAVKCQIHLPHLWQLSRPRTDLETILPRFERLVLALSSHAVHKVALRASNTASRPPSALQQPPSPCADDREVREAHLPSFISVHDLC